VDFTFHQLDPVKITVIPNRLEDMNAGKEPSKEALRKKWRIADTERVILFAGRLHPIKGLKYLIRAFHKVLDRMPESRGFTLT